MRRGVVAGRPSDRQPPRLAIRLRRLSLAAGAAFGLLLAGAAPAFAHAALISSNPGNGAVLASAPAEVLLQFDVPVTERLSFVYLFDSSGQRIRGTSLRSVPQNHSALLVELPPLPRGMYRLAYQTRDDTDLHQTGGSIVFGVGQAADLAGQPTSEARPSFTETAGRSVELVGIAVLVGVAVIWLVIVPMLRRQLPAAVLEPVLARAPRRLRGLAAAGYAAVAAGKIVQLLVALDGLATAHAGLLATVGSVLLSSRFGVLWLVGIALTVAVLVATAAAIDRRPHLAFGPRDALLGASVAALVIVCAQGSHGSNQSGLDPTQMTFRVVHLAAAGLWVGGLIVLTVLFAGTLRRGSLELGVALIAFRQFGSLAIMAVGLLGLSGLVLAAKGVWSPDALFSTTYGQTLTAKLIAGVAALAFGLRHAMLLEATHGGASDSPRLSLSVPFEIGAMFVVLWGAAALAATPPASTPVLAGAAPGAAVLQTDTTSPIDDLVVHSSLKPGHPGANTLFVVIQGNASSPMHPVTGVRITLTQPGRVPQRLTGLAIGHGRFEFPPIRVTRTGQVDVDVVIDRVGSHDEELDFPWIITDVPPTEPRTGLPTTSWAPELNGMAAGIALGMLVWALSGVRRARRRRAAARPLQDLAD